MGHHATNGSLWALENGSSGPPPLVSKSSFSSDENIFKEMDCIDISEIIASMNDWTEFFHVRIVTLAAYSIIFILGIIGNVGIMVSLVWSKDVKIVANVFLMNLSIIDVLLCLIAIPITPITAIFKQWYRNIVLMTSSPWKFKHAMWIITGGWGVGILLNVPVFNSQELDSIPGAHLPVCGIFCMPLHWDAFSKQTYGSLMFTLQFLLPVCLLAWCYTKILIKVRQDMVIGAVAGASQQSMAAARKTRVMLVLITMVGTFLVTWLPLTILNILRDFDVNLRPALNRQLFFFSNLFHFLAMTSVVWNPLLYFWLSKYRRRELASRRHTMTLLIRHTTLAAQNSLMFRSKRQSLPQQSPTSPQSDTFPSYDTTTIPSNNGKQRSSILFQLIRGKNRPHSNNNKRRQSSANNRQLNGGIIVVGEKSKVYRSHSDRPAATFKLSVEEERILSGSSEKTLATTSDRLSPMDANPCSHHQTISHRIDSSDKEQLGTSFISAKSFSDCLRESVPLLTVRQLPKLNHKIIISSHESSQ